MAKDERLELPLMVLETIVLPITPIQLVLRVGFGPTNGGTKTRCLTTWLPQNEAEDVGFEPTDTLEVHREISNLLH